MFYLPLFIPLVSTFSIHIRFHCIVRKRVHIKRLSPPIQYHLPISSSFTTLRVFFILHHHRQLPSASSEFTCPLDQGPITSFLYTFWVPTRHSSGAYLQPLSPSLPSRSTAPLPKPTTHHNIQNAKQRIQLKRLQPCLHTIPPKQQKLPRATLNPQR